MTTKGRRGVIYLFMDVPKATSLRPTIALTLTGISLALIPAGYASRAHKLMEKEV